MSLCSTMMRNSLLKGSKWLVSSSDRPMEDDCALSFILTAVS